MKKRTILALCVLSLVLVITAGYRLRGFLAIDHCLDSGGRWNYATGACEYAEKTKSPAEG